MAISVFEAKAAVSFQQYFVHVNVLIFKLELVPGNFYPLYDLFIVSVLCVYLRSGVCVRERGIDYKRLPCCD